MFSTILGLGALSQYVDAAFTIAAAIHVAALAVVNLTPTPKDNEFVAKAYKWVEVAAGVLHPNVKI
ncbi:hypothetical protein [Rhizobium sp. IMFF44]|uniref:hypothetical protein n=1 Tax=Rhizobium sp. IMFF44 TaxID=3342350 RepID=UPI0035B7D62E